MPIDLVNHSGKSRANTPYAGGALPRMVPVLATVKDNIDKFRVGTLRVYLADFSGSDPDNSMNWVKVRYMSPFYGLTTGSAPAAASDESKYGSYESNSSSYGMWTSPPDLGSTVICLFVDGDPDKGYYIGCIPKPEALHMVPAIGGSSNILTNNSDEAKNYGGATRLPVTNINSNDPSIDDSANFLNETKPVHSYAAAVLNQQGLIRDSVRGVIGTSAQRESPSRVGFGVSTPGRPIYQGGFTDETIVENSKQTTSPEKLKVIARRAGHSFVMDDGDIEGKDQLVRIRTATGHQILMSDDGQCLFIIHANGQSWIELGKEGTIDMYATNSVNIRSQGDLNLHADNNININASKTLNIAADNININSAKETTQRVGGAFSFYGMSKYTVKVDAGMSMASSGAASYASAGATYINGSVVNLNTGSAPLVPGAVKPITLTAHPDTLYDKTTGFSSAPGKLKSVVSRAPTHAPWSAWGQGVDVKVKLSASAALPAAPAPAVAATNATLPATPSNPVKSSVAATVPPVTTISPSADAGVSSTVIAQTSTLAASGVAKDAVKAGAAVVQQVGQAAQVALGPMALSLQQLQNAQVIKPGSSELMNKMTAKAATVLPGVINTVTKAAASVPFMTQAKINAATAAATSSLLDPSRILTPIMFTGSLGAESLPALVNNITAQSEVMCRNIQQAQTGLTNAGIMTGKEAGSQVASVLMTGATAGVNSAIAFVKNAAGAGTASSTVNSVLGSATTIMTAGAYAGKLSQVATAGMASLSKSLTSISKISLPDTKGITAAAFSAVTTAYPVLKSGVPVNLAALVSKIPAIPGTIDMNAALGLLGQGGSIPIKLPSFKIGTTDRGDISAQLSSLLGGPGAKTPSPNYKGNPATVGNTPVNSTLSKYETISAEIAATVDESFLQSIVVRNAAAAYSTARNSLPQGDSSIDSTKAAWVSEIEKLDKLNEKIKTLRASL